MQSVDCIPEAAIMAVNKGGTVERESLSTPLAYDVLGLLWGGKTFFI
jgi:hypothetical protein